MRGYTFEGTLPGRAQCHQACSRASCGYAICTVRSDRIADLGPFTGSTIDDRCNPRTCEAPGCRGTVCALAVSVAPAPARASCGHGVTSRESRSTGTAISELDALLTTATSSAGLPSEGQPAGLPCTGPSCSRRHGLPDAPARPSPVRGEPWCCTSGALHWCGPAPADTLAYLAVPHPHQSTSPIERPPRVRG
jgi:hypothetical protein